MFQRSRGRLSGWHCGFQWTLCRMFLDPEGIKGIWLYSEHFCKSLFIHTSILEAPNLFAFYLRNLRSLFCQCQAKSAGSRNFVTCITNRPPSLLHSQISSLLRGWRRRRLVGQNCLYLGSWASLAWNLHQTVARRPMIQLGKPPAKSGVLDVRDM